MKSLKIRKCFVVCRSSRDNEPIYVAVDLLHRDQLDVAVECELADVAREVDHELATGRVILDVGVIGTW